MEINFTCIFVDRHCSMKTNVLQKVGYCHSHVSRTFPSFIAKLSQGRGIDSMKLEAKNSFDNQDLQCLGRAEGEPHGSFLPWRNHGYGSELPAKHQGTNKSIMQQLHVWDCDSSENGKFQVCLCKCGVFSLSFSLIDNDFSLTF